jgi:hypothetical protein
MHFVKWKKGAGAIAVKRGGAWVALGIGCVTNVLGIPGYEPA